MSESPSTTSGILAIHVLRNFTLVYEAAWILIYDSLNIFFTEECNLAVKKRFTTGHFSTDDIRHDRYSLKHFFIHIVFVVSANN
jgi:hypothetical protein